jgi:uncharacterized surface protein with fasciclin (FAS1) repeats
MTKLTVGMAALAAAMLVQVSACDRAGPEAEPSAAAEKGGELPTLGSVVASAPSLSTFATALKDAELDKALDGAAPYTVLAPTNAAFASLGPAAAELKKPERREAVADMIREHVIPGYLTPDEIETSMARQGGKPVTMRTAGEGQVTFAKHGDGLTITGSNGREARIAGATLRAGNGAAIPIDTVLQTLPGA